MSLSRRAYLAAAGGTAALGLAGCLGTGSSGETVDSLPAPIQGDPDADVTVMVFEDFSCPHCQQYSLSVLPKLESDYVEPGTIRYEHHDYPIPVNQKWSWGAANAARAVQDTVDDAAFFDYAHALYENQGRYSFDLVEQLAGDVGADGEPVRTAAESGTYRPVLEADKELGKEMGLRGTPQVYVNGTQLGSYDYDTVSRSIDALL